MGMVVRTNTMAINAQRQLNLNNNAVSKSLEKLASGYKINRAADDAAGLAISERMKAQIKGLEAASSNSQDGISVVQTAEGALNEVHDMLNRMVELATKAANGVYTDTQRSNYADEVAQLQDEIDRIAESTNFNGIKLLDGTMGMNTDAVTVVGKTVAADAGVVATTGWGAVGNVHNENTVLHADAKAAAGSSFTLDLNGITLNNSSGANTTFTVSLGGHAFQITIAANTSANATAVATAIRNTLGGTSTAIQIDGHTITFTVGGTGGTVTFEMDDSAADFASDALLSGNLSVNITAQDSAVGSAVGTQDIAVTNITAGNKTTQGAQASAVFDIDVSRITTGSKLTIGNTTYVFQLDGEKATVGQGELLVTLNGITAENVANNENAVYTALTQAAAQNAPARDWDIGVNDQGKLAITENQANMAPAGQNKYVTESGIRNSVVFTAAAVAGGTTLNLTSTALKEGDTINVNGTRFTFTKNTANNGSNYVQIGDGTAVNEAFQKALQAAGFSAEIKNNGDLFISYNNAPVEVLGSGLTLQVGDTSDDFNKLNVSVNDMHADALGVAAHQIDITTQEGAGAAIDIINNAIDSVSRTRSSLGAIQNRLEHTINSLDTTTENLQSANSRIRDTDMAKEMMEYTKMNVLVQSAQAMLAQANQQPQSVLQLLQ